MTKPLSFLIALLCFTFIGCGSSVDMRSLVERLDRAEARATAAETERTRLESENADLMAGRTPERDTSGGESAPVVASAPVVGGGGSIMSAMPSTGMPGVVQMCDGVDGAGMLASGMLTSSMAFTPGSEPWGAHALDGLDYLVQNNSIFDVAIALDGRIVHIFSGGTPLMVTDSSGMCAMPAIPRRMSPMSPTSVHIPIVDNTDRPTHEIQYFCYRAGGGRLATAPAWRGAHTLYMAGSMSWMITNSLCGQATP